MPRAVAYHRPETLEAALLLLETPGRVVLGGGTALNTPGGDPVEVVDLQALDLTGIVHDGADAACGSMVTLQSIVEATGLPRIVRDGARKEEASVLRNQATVGGAVASGRSDSMFLAALLVSAASVELAGRSGTDTVPLSTVLDGGVGEAIVTSVRFETGGEGAMATTGRTPADTPIVAAVGRRTAGALAVAMTGVARTVVLVDPDDLASLDPPGDFRGSSEYRRHLATVLGRRVVEALA
ncbi:MAG: FAD binding domain-containing protein [Acidimicrobiia bacterium]